ncbi:MAG TPA: hypothetical protein DCM86_03695, partial [Verrucomicrobiales bacterium]|nr:hypothetical protein [Verrucomicrobiales bacterium]
MMPPHTHSVPPVAGPRRPALLTWLLILAIAPAASGATGQMLRVKDLAQVSGADETHLFGMGLVVGL